MITLIIFIIFITCLLAYLNWQVYCNWTKPRIEHANLEMKKIYEHWETMVQEKEKENKKL